MSGWRGIRTNGKVLYPPATGWSDQKFLIVEGDDATSNNPALTVNVVVKISIKEEEGEDSFNAAEAASWFTKKTKN